MCEVFKSHTHNVSVHQLVRYHQSKWIAFHGLNCFGYVISAPLSAQWNGFKYYNVTSTHSKILHSSRISFSNWILFQNSKRLNRILSNKWKLGLVSNSLLIEYITSALYLTFLYMIDFNVILTLPGLFYVYRLGNRAQCTFIIIYFLYT